MTSIPMIPPGVARFYRDLHRRAVRERYGATAVGRHCRILRSPKHLAPFGSAPAFAAPVKCSIHTHCEEFARGLPRISVVPLLCSNRRHWYVSQPT
jgi:hypothetical protein